MIEQNGMLGDVIFSADLATPIPTCPGWSMLHLLRHIGRGDRWAAHIINTGADGDLDPRTVPDGKPPDDSDAALAWLLASPRIVIDAVERIGPNEPVATFLGPRPAQWWIRRRLHEATVHRADAAFAAGQPYLMRADLAGDGIEEWLERLTVDQLRCTERALGLAQRIALTATDLGITWTISGTRQGIDWTTQPVKAPDVHLSGPASELFLVTVRRRATGQASGVHLDGLGEVWSAWLARTPL